MGHFSICTFKGKPAVQFHHDYGEFEFVIMRDPENDRALIFNSNVALTPKLYDLIGKQAVKQLKQFGKRFGYNMEDELDFDDITKILRGARNYAAQHGARP